MTEIGVIDAENVVLRSDFKILKQKIHFNLSYFTLLLFVLYVDQINAAL